jgi:hypothetical protein
VRMGSMRAGRVTGTVFDAGGAVVPWARIQVLVRGSREILKDISADDKGRFHLPGCDQEVTGWAFRAPDLI